MGSAGSVVTAGDAGIPGAVLPEAGTATDAGQVDAGGDPLDAAVDADAGDGAVSLPPLCDKTATDLLACFAFEGAATDESAAGLVPDMASNLSFVAGKEGQALELTLSPKSDLRLPFATLNTPAMTIEMWLRPASLPSAGGRMLLVDMNGRFGVTMGDDGTLSCRTVAALTKAAVGKWTHLACVHDGTSLTAYVDGKMEATAANTLASTADFVGIGQDSPSGADGFDGALDNLRFWGAARTAAEVAAAAAR